LCECKIGQSLARLFGWGQEWRKKAGTRALADEQSAENPLLVAVPDPQFYNSTVSGTPGAAAAPSAGYAPPRGHGHAVSGFVPGAVVTTASGAPSGAAAGVQAAASSSTPSPPPPLPRTPIPLPASRVKVDLPDGSEAEQLRSADGRLCIQFVRTLQKALMGKVKLGQLCTLEAGGRWVPQPVTTRGSTVAVKQVRAGGAGEGRGEEGGVLWP
jgi:hypothetical protein